MKATLTVAAAILLAIATPAFAHRVDEYLQATTIAVEKDRVRVEMRLTPGVDVFRTVLAFIDTDRDGIISDTEQRAYTQRVLRDLTLSVDGDRLALRVVSSKSAALDEMQEGRGVIEIALEAAVPRGGADRKLAFENNHLSSIGAYLVNGLVPRDPDIQVNGQRRNYQQSSYRMDYVQAGASAGPRSHPWSSGIVGWLATAAIVLIAGASLLQRRRATAAKRLDAATTYTRRGWRIAPSPHHHDHAGLIFGCCRSQSHSGRAAAFGSAPAPHPGRQTDRLTTEA